VRRRVVRLRAYNLLRRLVIRPSHPHIPPCGGASLLRQEVVGLSP
jgi:hypothetical protein